MNTSIPLLGLTALVAIPLVVVSSAPGESKDDVSTITVKMKGFRSSDGKSLVQLYHHKKGFPTKPSNAWKRTKTEIDKKTATATFADIPPGTYAISVIHDEDGDGKLKTGLLRIPQEGVGVSGNASGMPTFKKAKFDLKQDDLTVIIKIKYL